MIRTERHCENCKKDKPKDGFEWMDLVTRREWWCADCQKTEKTPKVELRSPALTTEKAARGVAPAELEGEAHES